MAYFYVKSGGTATGDGGRYASEKASGTWAATFAGTTEYYGSILAAMGATTTPTHGDYIIVSDLHAHSAASISLTGPTTNGVGIVVVCVSDTDVQACSSGGEELASTGDIVVDGHISFTGMKLRFADDLIPSGAYSGSRYANCTFEPTGGSDAVAVGGDGSYTLFNDCTVNFTVASQLFKINNAAELFMHGGAVTSTVATVSLIGAGFAAAGGRAEFRGVDLSDIDQYILEDAGSSSTGEDMINIFLEGCKLNASLVDWVEETFTDSSMRFEAVRCGSSSAIAEHQYYLNTLYGEAEDQDDSGIHRDETPAFPVSGTKISLKIDSSANVSKMLPFSTDIPSTWAALSTASTDTVRVYLASTTTLNTDDVWVDVCYPDGTDNHQFNHATSAPTMTGSTAIDPLRASTTELTTDTGSAWKDGVSDLTGYNEYYIDVDTSGDPGADCAPVITIHVAKPSITVYLDPVVDIVA